MMDRNQIRKLIGNLKSDEKVNIMKWVALNNMNRGINHKRNHDQIGSKTEFKMAWKTFMKNLKNTNNPLEMAYQDVQESFEVVMGWIQ